MHTMRISSGRLPAYPTPQTRNAPEGTRESATPSRMSGYPAVQRNQEGCVPQPCVRWSGWRMMLLGMVLTEVTVGLLLGLFFLCVDGTLRIALPALALPASMLPLVLLSVGGSAGILLGIMLSHLWQRKRLVVPAERRMASGAHLRASSQRLVLPEPAGRSGLLFAPADEADGASWRAASWDREQPMHQHTETLEATQMRQRLRTLPLSYTDAVPGKRQTDQLYQIQRVGSRMLLFKEHEQ